MLRVRIAERAVESYDLGFCENSHRLQRRITYTKSISIGKIAMPDTATSEPHRKAGSQSTAGSKRALRSGDHPASRSDGRGERRAANSLDALAASWDWPGRGPLLSITFIGYRGRCGYDEHWLANHYLGMSDKHILWSWTTRVTIVGRIVYVFVSTLPTCGAELMNKRASRERWLRCGNT
jgi:hypothetical protein